MRLGLLCWTFKLHTRAVLSLYLASWVEVWHICNDCVPTGLLWQLRPSDVEVELLAHTRNVISRDLEEETGLHTGWIQNGGLFIASNKQRLDEYKRLMSVRIYEFIFQVSIYLNTMSQKHLQHATVDIVKNTKGHRTDQVSLWSQYSYYLLQSLMFIIIHIFQIFYKSAGVCKILTHLCLCWKKEVDIFVFRCLLAHYQLNWLLVFKVHRELSWCMVCSDLDKHKPVWGGSSVKTWWVICSTSSCIYFRGWNIIARVNVLALVAMLVCFHLTQNSGVSSSLCITHNTVVAT